MRALVTMGLLAGSAGVTDGLCATVALGSSGADEQRRRVTHYPADGVTPCDPSALQQGQLVGGVIGGEAGMVVIDDLVVVGSCPWCGSDGQVVDGAYKLTGDVAELLTKLDRDDLRRLQVVLSTVPDDATADAVAARITNEVPEAAQVADLVTHYGASWPIWLPIILMMLQVLVAGGGLAFEIQQAREQQHY